MLLLLLLLLQQRQSTSPTMHNEWLTVPSVTHRLQRVDLLTRNTA
jgi:hypothetical protein